MSNLHFKNVLKQQIYASKPSYFNDPFDCVLGVSNQVILSAILMKLINLEYINPIKIEALKKLITENNPVKLKDYLNKQPLNLLNDILQAALKDRNIYNLLQNAANEQRIADEELREIFIQIFKDPEFLNSFIQNFIRSDYLSYENLENFKSLFLNNIELISDYFESIIDFDEEGNVCYLNISLNKLGEMASKQGYNINKDIKLLQKNLDFSCLIAKQNLEEFRKKLDEYFGITCFSSKSDIVLMWSHYAKKHTGFVIEYDFSELSIQDAHKVAFLMPVKYSKYRPNLDIRFMEYFNRIGKELSFSDTFLGTIISTLYTKSDIWKYEKERNLVFIGKITKEKSHLNISTA